MGVFKRVFFSAQVRLGGGSADNVGHVMVLGSNGTWGGVCDNDWDINDGHVVCRMLGYPSAETIITNKQNILDYYYSYDDYDYIYDEPETGDTFVLDKLGCTGSESSIFDCIHDGEWNANDCEYIMIAGVRCKQS